MTLQNIRVSMPIQSDGGKCGVEGLRTLQVLEFKASLVKAC